MKSRDLFPMFRQFWRKTVRKFQAHMRMPRAKAFVYVVRCADGSLYTGWTNDLARRMAAHRSGTGAKYVRARRFEDLLAFWRLADRASAMRLEAEFKRFDRAQKLVALERAQVLGRRLLKAPLIPTVMRKALMPSLQPPTPQEVTERSAEARTSIVRIETERGTIDLKLFPDDAPVHVASFLNLIHQGFYNDVPFHRVEPDFVVQAGCPDGDGTGGPGYRINAEFNERKHLTGTLAMARTSDPNSAGSQFYICLKPAPFLDRQYTVFGETVAGLDVISKIKRGDKMTSVTVVPA